MLINLLFNPHMPEMADYYGRDVYTFTYDDLYTTKQLTQQPIARPKSMVTGAPFVVKLHMIVIFVFLAYFPFTKLVHAFSYPFAYFTRPYISMRSYVGLKK